MLRCLLHRLLLSGWICEPRSQIFARFTWRVSSAYHGRHICHFLNMSVFAADLYLDKICSTFSSVSYEKLVDIDLQRCYLFFSIISTKQAILWVGTFMANINDCFHTLFHDALQMSTIYLSTNVHSFRRQVYCIAWSVFFFYIFIAFSY